MIKTSPAEVYAEYLEAKSYNASIDLEERVKTYENFFIGKQWEGVNAPDMDKPVFNILKRVINYFIAMLASDSVGITIRTFNRKETPQLRAINEALKEQILQVMEQNAYPKLTRSMLRDAAVDGDGCIHLYYDTEEENADGYFGKIACELINNTDVFFANPFECSAARQPYIIIASSRSTKSVISEMRKNGINVSDIESFTEDNYDERHYDYENRCTVLTKYYKQDGRIWFTKIVKDAVIKPPTCTMLKNYPVCYMNWERVKGSYHGAGVIEGLIPNQIAINKMAAMAEQFIKQQAFPRVFYNRNKLKSWNGGIKPIGVTGDPNDILYTDRHATQMSAQVGEYIDRFIGNTKDLMGASDAALGNVTPDNTSAIIAVQKSTAIPLELVRQEYYRFTEDFVRICIDMMSCYYGTRTMYLDIEGKEYEKDIDFSAFNTSRLNLNIDIGTAAYWSEITSSTTLDNLYKSGLIDPVTYLESLPQSSVANKTRLIDEARKRKEENNGINGTAADGLAK